MNHTFKISSRPSYVFYETVFMLLFFIAGIGIFLINHSISDVWDKYHTVIMILSGFLFVSLYRQSKETVFQADGTTISMLEKNSPFKAGKYIVTGAEDVTGYKHMRDTLEVYLVNDTQITLRHLRKKDVLRITQYLTGRPAKEGRLLGPAFRIRMPLWDKAIKLLIWPLPLAVIVYQFMNAYSLQEVVPLTCLIIFSYLSVRRFMGTLLRLKDPFLFYSDGAFIYGYNGNTVEGMPAHMLSGFEVGGMSSPHRLVMKNGKSLTTGYLRRADIQLLESLNNPPEKEKQKIVIGQD